MKKNYLLIFMILALMLILSNISCGSFNKGMNDSYEAVPDIYYQNGQSNKFSELYDYNHETYNKVVELPFIKTSDSSETYITLDSSTASYGTLKRYIENKYKNENSIRTDEIINYFKYDLPEANDTFTSSASITKSAWNNNTYLLTLGIRSKETKLENYSQGNNYCFLIDVSGSMQGEARIELVKKSFKLLTESLSDKDIVSIVTYASGVKVLLSGQKADDKGKAKINDILSSLSAGGSTAGGSAIERAYEILKANHIDGGNNRIILATDGDFNVGVNNPTDLIDLIKQHAGYKQYLTVLGYGMMNYRDDMMQSMAVAGNGNYAYINDISDANKVLIEEADKTLCVVASDVKSKLSFNSDIVDEYRLIGYESKVIDKTQYQDDTYDAGEVGSNLTTMICIELKVKENVTVFNQAINLEIKYKDPFTNEDFVYNNNFETLDITLDNYTNDQLFINGLIEFVLCFRNSEYKADATVTHAKELIELSTNNDKYRVEFLSLIEKYLSYQQ